MLTTRQILDLIAGPSFGLAGAIAAARRFGATPSPNGPAQLSIEERRFIDDIEARQVSRRVTYSHPADAVRGLPPNTKTVLGPTDLAWLERLPADPAQITFQDATELAQLAANISKFDDRSDARLIEAIYAPVRDIHDRRAAETALQAAQQPLPPTPSSAVGALAAAIGRETSGLTATEIINRASDILLEDRKKREAAREYEIDRARAAIRALDDSIAERQAVRR